MPRTNEVQNNQKIRKQVKLNSKNSVKDQQQKREKRKKRLRKSVQKRYKKKRQKNKKQEVTTNRKNSGKEKKNVAEERIVDVSPKSWSKKAKVNLLLTVNLVAHAHQSLEHPNGTLSVCLCVFLRLPVCLFLPLHLSQWLSVCFYWYSVCIPSSPSLLVSLSFYLPWWLSVCS